MFSSFQNNFQRRVDDGESAAVVIADEYDIGIKAGASPLGGKFLLGKKPLLEEILAKSFDSMGDIPLPIALTQGIIAYWTGGIYTNDAIVSVAGTPPSMVMPAPSPVAAFLPTFTGHLGTIEAIIPWGAKVILTDDTYTFPPGESVPKWTEIHEGQVNDNGEWHDAPYTVTSDNAIAGPEIEDFGYIVT